MAAPAPASASASGSSGGPTAAATAGASSAAKALAAAVVHPLFQKGALKHFQPKPPAAAAAAAAATATAGAGSDLFDTEKKATLPWIEKYRPSQLDDLISHTEIITTVKRLLDKGELPHLLLYGPPGTGKTSTILAIARQLNGAQFNSMVLELNASDDRGIDVVREQIKDFASSRKLFSHGVKLVILDEADSMTSAAQMALRRVIEQYTKSTRFCLIANYIHKLIPALQSRCTRFRFGPLKEEHIATRLGQIIAHEHVKIDDAGRRAVMRLANGDMRKVLNVLQSCHMAYGHVTEQNVYLCTGNPLPTDISDCLHSLMNDSFGGAFGTIARLQQHKGLSLVDIVQRLHDEILKVNYPPPVLSILLDQLSNVEYRLAFGTSEKLQLGAVVGAFQLAKDKLFADAAAAGAADATAAAMTDDKPAAAAAAAKPAAATAAAAANKPSTAAAGGKNLLHK